jgi:hypothetical protein
VIANEGTGSMNQTYSFVAPPSAFRVAPALVALRQTGPRARRRSWGHGRPIEPRSG